MISVFFPSVMMMMTNEWTNSFLTDEILRFSIFNFSHNDFTFMEFFFAKHLIHSSLFSNVSFSYHFYWAIFQALFLFSLLLLFWYVNDLTEDVLYNRVFFVRSCYQNISLFHLTYTATTEVHTSFYGDDVTLSQEARTKKFLVGKVYFERTHKKPFYKAFCSFRTIAKT